MLRAIGQLDEVFAVVDGGELHDAIRADDSGTMDAKKFGRVEFLFERIHGFAQKMRAAADVQLRVVPGGSDPVGIIGVDDLNARAGADDEARGVFFGVAAEHAEDSLGHLELGGGIAKLAGALDGGGEAVVVHRLEQIIEGVDFEGAQSMLLVSREKDDAGQIPLGQGAKDFETVHTGHLDIEEDDIGRKLEDFLYCRQAVGAFADDFDVLEFAQAENDAAAGKAFVIDNQGAHDAAPWGCVLLRNGSSTVTSQPPVSGHCSRNL